MKRIITTLLFVYSLNLAFSQDLPIPEKLMSAYNELKTSLKAEGIPEDWLIANTLDPKFSIYYFIEDYFHNMAENKVAREEHDLEWYKAHFGADHKIEQGIDFIMKHRELMENVEAKRDIHYEIVVAILALETNFADTKYKGKFYTFPTLVTQYILTPKRKNFALTELVALYRFSITTGHETYYFIGSFAGACGWAQFIPSSLEKYFVDSNDVTSDIDIYDINDAVFSIENYLVSFGLSELNMDSYLNRYYAVYMYNHSKAYAETVLYIYDGMRALRGSY